MTIPKPLDDDQRGGAQTLLRAVALLRSVASRTDGASLSELVGASGLTKPTVRRLLLSLIGNGLVEQESESRRYHVGPEVYALGLLATSRFEAPREIANSVRRLATDSGDAAMLSVEQGRYALCTFREDGTFPLRTHALQPGNRHPLGVGAAGLALLAARSDAEVTAYLGKNAAQVRADYPHFDENGVRDEIRRCRARGYSLNAGLVVPGSWGIAAALRDPRTGIAFAVTIAAVQSRLEGPRLNELGEMLKQEKQRLQACWQMEADGAPRESGACPLGECR